MVWEKVRGYIRLTFPKQLINGLGMRSSWDFDERDPADVDIYALGSFDLECDKEDMDVLAEQGDESKSDSSEDLQEDENGVVDIPVRWSFEARQ